MHGAGSASHHSSHAGGCGGRQVQHSHSSLCSLLLGLDIYL